MQFRPRAGVEIKKNDVRDGRKWVWIGLHLRKKLKRKKQEEVSKNARKSLLLNGKTNGSKQVQNRFKEHD